MSFVIFFSVAVLAWKAALIAGLFDRRSRLARLLFRHRAASTQHTDTRTPPMIAREMQGGRSYRLVDETPTTTLSYSRRAAEEGSLPAGTVIRLRFGTSPGTRAVHGLCAVAVRVEGTGPTRLIAHEVEVEELVQ